MAPAVAVACASKHCAQLAALLATTLDAQLSSSTAGAYVVAGAAAPTLADVVIFAALYPLLADAADGAANAGWGLYKL